MKNLQIYSYVTLEEEYIPENDKVALKDVHKFTFFIVLYHKNSLKNLKKLIHRSENFFLVRGIFGIQIRKVNQILHAF